MKKIFRYLLGDLKKSFKLEKRSFYRKEFHKSVVFIVISRHEDDKSSKQQEGTALDLSILGMCFLVNHLRYDGLHVWKDDSFLDPNYLKIAFMLPGYKNPIEVLAEVVSFSLAGPRYIKQYKLGVKFTDIKSDAREAIKRYMEK